MKQALAECKPLYYAFFETLFDKAQQVRGAQKPGEEQYHAYSLEDKP